LKVLEKTLNLLQIVPMELKATADRRV